MKTKANNPPPLLDWGVASLAFQGETVSGDQHVVQPFPNGVLVAAVDGVGHGAAAAAAAKVAVATCHADLRETRGVVLTLASFKPLDGTITWAGVGNVEGVLLRADAKGGPARDYVLLLGGVVGLQLPPLRGFGIPVSPGDTLILATDGIRSGFAERLPLENSPQQIADHVLSRDAKGTDDALVLVARYLGGSS